MRHIVATAMTALAVSLMASGVCAAPFKWASQGDILTFDPHAQNESFNNAANSYIYESLVRYGKGSTIELEDRSGRFSIQNSSKCEIP